MFVTERPGHAGELARAAAHRGARLVLAWGGDGTINEVASALAFGEVPLGIVPAGSGNGLATELGIDRRPTDAIAAALRAEPHLIDLGEIDGRLFANIAGIGIDAHIAASFNQPGNRRRGFLGYVRITGRALFTYTPAIYKIEASEGCGAPRAAGEATVVHSRAVLITIANSAQFGNNARIAPNARVDDGVLDLVVFEERSRLRTVTYLPKLFNGTIEQVPGCRILRIRRATIESDRPMTFHVDGEAVSGGTTLRIRVHPSALPVAVKRPRPERERSSSDRSGGGVPATGNLR